ncbi:hypothetical protein LINPERHAP2_LOCUS28894 [Linum perenne]
MTEDTLVNPRCPKIPFSDEEIKSFYRPWSKALVVKVLEKSFSYLAMKRRLEFLWAKSGPIQVADLSNNFFMVRFDNKEDYSLAAFKGPWKIYDYYITVSQWTPSFNEEAPIRTILTWVRLPKLPIHFFNEVAVSRIGNCIGRTVRLDLATTEGTRGRYARVCVEVDLSKPLLGKYVIEDRIFKVEYESLENVCFDCGFYGHKKENCPSSEPTHPEKPTEMAATSSDLEVVASEQDTGEWMTVQRRHRRKANPQQVASAPVKHTGKFSVLQVDEPEISNTAETDQEKLIKSQAEKLRKVLDEALKSPPQARPTDPAPQNPSQVLTNITNTEATRRKAKGVQKANANSSHIPEASEAEERLVAVPIMYQNIAFQANTKELGATKFKQPARKNTGVKAKGPEIGIDILTPRRKALKSKTLKPDQTATVGSTSKDMEIEALKTRKPPDRS